MYMLVSDNTSLRRVDLCALFCSINCLTGTFQNQSKAAFSLSSMRTRLFGSDTPEQKEVKLAQLEEDLKRTETQLKTQTAEAQ